MLLRIEDKNELKFSDKDPISSLDIIFNPLVKSPLNISLNIDSIFLIDLIVLFIIRIRNAELIIIKIIAVMIPD